MTEKLNTLLRITQFGAIKVAPGFVNILMIPYLHTMMGGGLFGRFSLFLGYALLTITVLGSVITQPMYRFLSSDRHSLSNFHAFGFLAGGFGALAGAVVVLLIDGTAIQALIGAAFVFCAIFYTVVTTRYQIEAQIWRLARFEAARVAVLCGVILAVPLLSKRLGLEYAMLAFLLSYLIPILPLINRLEIKWPDPRWLRSRLGFGSRSAIWLVLAGLPFALSKTLLTKHLSAVELGAYSANVDMFYRLFSMLNIAFVMWAFPTMSVAYDEGRSRDVRRTLLFGAGVYIVAGLVVITIVGVGATFVGQFPGQLAEGLTPFVLILIMGFLWQGMSLAHKPLEMAQQTGIMTWLMAICFVQFVVLSWLLLASEWLLPVTAVCSALIACSLSYITIVIYVGLKGRKLT